MSVAPASRGRIAELVREPIAIVPYDSQWPERFRLEAAHLRSCLPGDLVGRIEHFGSTAIPGLAAKPIVDMLVEPHFEHWDSLLFRDYLIERPDLACEYEALKIALSSESPDDRVAHTRDKSAFVARVTAEAKRRYGR
ncbi:MAG TPA: GrpB family protein [Vicinamibacterales bacterium]|nr:GrpB family protein [Vicinamibacterales bacterium]